MLCLVHYLFVISTSVIDCLGRFVPEMTCYVSNGTLNLTKLKLKLFRPRRRSGGVLYSFPAGPGGVGPPNDIWCIFGLKKFPSDDSNFSAVHKMIETAHKNPSIRRGKNCETKADFFSTSAQHRHNFPNG